MKKIGKLLVISKKDTHKQYIIDGLLFCAVLIAPVVHLQKNGAMGSLGIKKGLKLYSMQLCIMQHTRCTRVKFPTVLKWEITCLKNFFLLNEMCNLLPVLWL